MSDELHSITIRKIPDDVAHALKVAAVHMGMSREKMLRRLLMDAAFPPSTAELSDTDPQPVCYQCGITATAYITVFPSGTRDVCDAFPQCTPKE